MDNYLGFVNNQSVETENKKNKNLTRLDLNLRYCNNKCRKRKKNHEPVYNRVNNQSLETENKKQKFNAFKFKTWGTVTINAANVKKNHEPVYNRVKLSMIKT